ncbi:MAG: YraN family protein [Proteobacteria bacterium]|nr:YraN family protein [Pseudomonadota bacterium]
MLKPRQKSEIFGRFGEIVAIVFMTLKFYRLVSWREKTKAGEIDLIFIKGKALVFVEVKARKTIEIARASINKNQQKRIISGASHFTIRNQWAQKMAWRYDAILIAPFKFPVHIKNAF